jgi:RHS repeat-associated protein
VAKGTLSSWPTACQAPSTGNGFSLNVQYVIGLGGEQLTELQANNAWSHTNVFGGGGLLATYSGSDTIYALTDWQGTKRGETSAGGCLGSWSSLPFGNDLTQAGNCVDASEHHYTGKVRDSETGYASGNDDFGARYYASSIGHWLSPDWAASAEAVPYASYGSPQTLNLYAFVGNNPLSDADPDGHSSYGEQMMCSNGPTGGQCGVGTDPGDQEIYSSDGMGPAAGDNNLWSPEQTAYSRYLAGETDLAGDPVAQQQSSSTTSSSSASADPIATALSNVPGVASVTPAPDPTRDKAIGGHQNETDALTFATPADQAKFLAESSRKHLISGDVSENGYGPGVRLSGGLHAEQGRLDPRTGQFLVTAHIDRFNANNGLAPLVGHFLVDVLYGSIRYPHSAGLDH